MNIEYVVIICVASLVIGFLVGRMTHKNAKNADSLRKELDKTKSELASYKQEMVAHFSNSADILDKMARDYRQLYDYMAKSSAHILSNTDINKTPFPALTTLTDIDSNKPKYEAPPRDYSEGASGLFNAQPSSDKS